MTDVASQVFSKIATQIKGGVVTDFTGLVQELSADGMELVGEEAEDFGTLIDDFTMGLEAGKSPRDAWDAAWAPYATKAYSDLWNEAIKAVRQVSDFIHSIVTLIEAAI